MSLKSICAKCLPFLFGKADPVDQERGGLLARATNSCDPGALARVDSINLADILHAPGTEASWRDARDRLSRFDIVDGTGGVNPGDRRAIYYLIHHLRPASVLEVGTHIGASTLHIAAALSAAAGEGGTPGKLVSVDINDVNSTETQPWLKYGSAMSPAAMMREMGFNSFVDFITRDSHDFLVSCQDRFDFIFLDGDHAASTVYQEVPAALNLLNPGGIILLHDYFPGLKPLWSNGSLIPGPFLATERLRSEGARLRVLPLGELPWPTKLGSHVTSLALLLQDR
jgi:predicted O-methyltransferase YrrM